MVGAHLQSTGRAMTRPSSQVLDSTGKCVLDFVADYVSPNSGYKSGWGTCGLRAAAVRVIPATEQRRECRHLALARRKQQSRSTSSARRTLRPRARRTGTSATATPLRSTRDSCGSAGFRWNPVPRSFEQPFEDWGCNNRVTKPVSSTVTNTATAAVVYKVTYTDNGQATVEIDASPQGWSQCSKY